MQGKISARLVGSLLEDRTSRRSVKGARHVGLLHEQKAGAELESHTQFLTPPPPLSPPLLPSLPQRVQAPVGSSLNLRSRASEADVSKRGALVEKALLQQLDALGVLKKSDQPAGTGELPGNSPGGASEQASARARRAVKREDATDLSEDPSGSAAQESSAGPADEVLQELQIVSKALEQEDAFILGILTRLRRVAQPAALRREVSAREEERHRDELDVEMLQLYHQRLAYAQLHEVCPRRGGGLKTCLCSDFLSFSADHVCFATRLKQEPPAELRGRIDTTLRRHQTWSQRAATPTPEAVCSVQASPGLPPPPLISAVPLTRPFRSLTCSFHTGSSHPADTSIDQGQRRRGTARQLVERQGAAQEEEEAKQCLKPLAARVITHLPVDTPCNTPHYISIRPFYSI